MRNKIAEMILLSLAVCFTGAVASPDAQAKSYTYKYKFSETVKSSFPNEAVVGGPVVVERPLATRIVERPVVVKRTYTRPMYARRRIAARPYVRRVVSRPVIVERRVIMERPVYQTAYPVMVERPVYVEHHHKGLIPKIYSMIF